MSFRIGRGRGGSEVGCWVISVWWKLSWWSVLGVWVSCDVYWLGDGVES